MNQRTVAFLVTALAVLAVLAIAIFALACEVPSGVAGALGLQQELPTAPTAQIVADFSWDQRPTNMIVDFTNTSTGPFVESFWDFGDGDTSRRRDPEHEYAAKGDYTVRLRACPGSDQFDPDCDEQIKTIQVVWP